MRGREQVQEVLRAHALVSGCLIVLDIMQSADRTIDPCTNAESRGRAKAVHPGTGVSRR